MYSKTTRVAECAEGVASDERLGDISSVRIDDGLTSQTNFGDKEFIEPSALMMSSDDTLVDEGSEAPNSRLSPMKMRILTPASGVMHTGSASTMLRTSLTSSSLELL